MDLVQLQPNVFTSVTTDVGREKLWKVVSDPQLLADFSTELQEVRLLADGPVDMGSVFEGDQLRGERRWTTTSTVTGFEPGRLFEWTVGDLEHPVSRWSFLLDENSAGMTLIHKATLLGGPSPLSDLLVEHPERAEEIIQERLAILRERMATTLEGLLALAGVTPS